jgi:diaminopimelate epimerase
LGEEKFFKYHHLGNEFIFFDNRGGNFLVGKEFIERVCDKNIGIGADGVILLEGSEKFNYKMRIFNSDGSEAEACGNGVLCFLKFLEDLALWDFKKNVFIEIMRGFVEGRKEGEKYLGIFKRPKVLKERVVLDLEGKSLELVFLDVFVPHVVLFVKGLEELDVEGLGRKIRNQKIFFKKGVNVNFVEIKGRKIFVRVYERGVEGETLSCGTGALAVASVLRGSKGFEMDRFFLNFRRGEMEVGFLGERAFLKGRPEFLGGF